MKIKEIIIAILLLLLGGSGYYGLDKLGNSGGNNAYLSSVPSYSTTTVPTCKRSIYRGYPTSSDPTAYVWICATTTGSGTPWTVLPENTSRFGFECCNVSSGVATTTLWLSNTTSTNMTVGTNSTGFQIVYQDSTRFGTRQNCFNTNDYGIVWGGKVLGLADTTTSTLRCVEFK